MMKLGHDVLGLSATSVYVCVPPDELENLLTNIITKISKNKYSHSTGLQENINRKAPFKLMH